MLAFMLGLFSAVFSRLRAFRVRPRQVHERSPARAVLADAFRTPMVHALFVDSLPSIGFGRRVSDSLVLEVGNLFELLFHELKSLGVTFDSVWNRRFSSMVHQPATFAAHYGHGCPRLGIRAQQIRHVSHSCPARARRQPQTVLELRAKRQTIIGKVA